MHLDFCEVEEEPERRGRREAIAAPRGHAKTTFKLLLKSIHAIVYGYERYIVIIAQSAMEAEDRVRQILDELETNQRLIDVYGTLAPKNSKPGRKKSFVTQNGIKVQAKSIGQQIRGIKHGGDRPTLLILDDVETLEAVQSPQHRFKTSDWFFKDVLKCGQTDGSSNVIFIGTCLHQESLLSDLLQRPGWSSHKYQAVIKFSAAQTLWDQWKAIYTELSNPNREADAQTFFEANKDALLLGTEVLWPETEPYLALMKQMVSEGAAAFHSEKQNEPYDPERQIFDMDRARYFIFDPASQEIRKIDDPKHPFSASSLTQIVAFHDPAMGREAGKTGSSDYAAIVVVGQDSYGYLYVLDCYLSKESPSTQIEQAFRLYQKWQFQALYFEANGFQDLMYQMYADYQKQHGIKPMLRVMGVDQYTNKLQRIATLEPDISNGHILFSKSLDLRLIQQLSLFPTTHDDGPDALQGAVFHLKNTTNRRSFFGYSRGKGTSRQPNPRQPWQRKK